MRIYTETLECGCMLSEDGGGGLIPCETGLWYMTPKEFAGPLPSNHQIHIDAWEKASKEKR